MADLDTLCDKLCRELAQSEHSASVHPEREARRLGNTAPARALRGISAHAKTLHPAIATMCGTRTTFEIRMARLVGEVVSVLRHTVFDRMVDTERSYRGTLLGVRHGLDVARVLREVAMRRGQVGLVAFCDQLLRERSLLLEDAEDALVWFAEEPNTALTSGLRAGLRPASLG